MSETKFSIRVTKPTTATRRGTTFVRRDHLKRTRPIKALVKKHKRSLGRDVLGRISVRHRGGGAKRLYRVISTLGQCGTGPFKVIWLEYDPNRSAHIALIKNKAGRQFYILAAADTKPGHELEYGRGASINASNRLPVGQIPTGIEVHGLNLTPQGPIRVARAAGNKATIMAHEGNFTLIKLPSGEVRRFDKRCEASIGALSNEAHNTVRLGKVGRRRHMGVRPTVRGKAMYPAAHPHGGGEGNTSIGMKAPKTPWGKRTMGVKTRRRQDRGGFILKQRSKKRRTR